MTDRLLTTRQVAEMIGVSTETARIMGTSVSMIEAHYGTLIAGAHDSILTRL